MFCRPDCIYRFSQENLPHVDPKTWNAFTQLHTNQEQQLLTTTKSNSAKYGVNKQEVVCGYGLVSGLREIPKNTLIALYFSDVLEQALGCDSNAYLFTYGKGLGRVLVLDGRERLDTLPNMNGATVNHSCCNSNCKFEWNGVFLTVVTRVAIPPLTELTVDYGSGYFNDNQTTKALLLQGVPIRHCQCKNPKLCPKNRSMKI